MKTPLLLTALGLSIGCPALAENDPADATPTTLEPVVVTATRTPESEDRTLASVSVVDRATIERRQLRSVPDALRGLPGVTVATGGISQVYLRGTNANHVLVLVDGVKVGSSASGDTPWQDLPIEQIERIEVVRGPRSSLYGSEAIGGVIQIFTRRGGGALTPRFGVGAGAFQTASISGGLTGGGDHGWFNLGANFEQSDGINACYGDPLSFAGCGVVEPDLDGYRRLGGSARAGYRFSERAELDFSYLGANNESDFDGSLFSGNHLRSAQQVLGAKARFKPLDPWVLTFAAGRSLDKYSVSYTDAFIQDLPTGTFDTERDTLSVQNDVTVRPGHLLTLGLDYQEDRLETTIDYSEDSRDNLGVFGQYQGELGAASLHLSLRQDDNQQFGTNNTGNAALGWRFTDGVRGSISYGTAFKAPTFTDLYYPAPFGNPELEPEESESLELDLGGTIARNPWDARGGMSLFQTDIDQLIAYDPTTQTVENVAQAEIRGLELSGSARVMDWELSLSLTLQDPRNRSEGPNDGNLLARRPEQMGELNLDRRFERWSAGATLFVSGRRFDDPANTRTLPAYALVSLRADYAFTPALRIQGRVENLFDQEYETASYYNEPGTAVFVTLRYEP